MSALPPKADIRPRDQDVCFGPKGDSCTAAINALLRTALPNFRQQLMWTLQASSAPLGDQLNMIWIIIVDEKNL
jgi:hypothetical protein